MLSATILSLCGHQVDTRKVYRLISSKRIPPCIQTHPFELTLENLEGNTCLSDLAFKNRTNDAGDEITLFDASLRSSDLLQTSSIDLGESVDPAAADVLNDVDIIELGGGVDGFVTRLEVPEPGPALLLLAGLGGLATCQARRAQMRRSRPSQ